MWIQTQDGEIINVDEVHWFSKDAVNPDGTNGLLWTVYANISKGSTLIELGVIHNVDNATAERVMSRLRVLLKPVDVTAAVPAKPLDILWNTIHATVERTARTHMFTESLEHADNLDRTTLPFNTFVNEITHQVFCAIGEVTTPETSATVAELVRASVSVSAWMPLYHGGERTAYDRLRRAIHAVDPTFFAEEDAK